MFYIRILSCSLDLFQRGNIKYFNTVIRLYTVILVHINHFHFSVHYIYKYSISEHFYVKGPVNFPFIQRARFTLADRSVPRGAHRVRGVLVARRRQSRQQPPAALAPDRPPHRVAPHPRRDWRRHVQHAQPSSG